MDPLYMLQVSTHGDMQNQVAVWKYPGLAQLASLAGPTSGANYMAMSPDGEVIVTGGGGEILCFWNVFTRPRTQKVSAQFIHWGIFF
jgi:cell division cycle 20-like protein 1 (cofactor of APC complex)